MTTDEMIAAREAFIKRWGRGFWPNEVMWECWKDAWLAGALADRKACADAVTKERERCALLCEEFYSVEGVAQKCAAAIRKGEKESLTGAEQKPVPEFELIEKWEGE
jgi:hypothetical protein